MAINYREFIHPEDEAARRQLEAVPGFETVTQYFMNLGVEKFFHGLFMAEKIRLSPTQLPELYNELPPVCQKFGIREPEFYLEMNPAPNAYTVGDKQTFLVITSGLLAHVKGEELTAVIAHECGHILCRHVFYSSMAGLMVYAADALGLIGNLAKPVELALNYWMRRSELSADRAEIVYLGKSGPAVNTLIRLSGGPYDITGKVNVEEYASQAQYYQDLRDHSKWHKLLQNVAILERNHPFSAVRVQELLMWEKSEQYQRLRAALENHAASNVCSKCGREIAVGSKFCRFCGTRQND